MIRVFEIKLPCEEILFGVPFEEQLLPRVAKRLGIDASLILSLAVRRHAIDARKKPALFDVFTVDVSVAEGTVLHATGKVLEVEERSYAFPGDGDALRKRPVIAGFGPAGIFCAYELALHGARPVVIERGADTDTRVRDVERFWKDGVFHPASNVQFGEGGAGTFSDGKLNSGIKDKSGRIREVLNVLVEHGAPEEILYEAEPHIGTDLLRDVVKRIRAHIIALGGEVHFNTKLTGIEVEDGRVTAAIVESRRIETDTIVLAIGHSARDTFRMLNGAGIKMEQKAFAVGLRVLHPQEKIDLAQYGRARDMEPPASYKLTHQTLSGRGVYSFCMCPGGYVVNASSEEGGLCVNGMSDHARDSGSANAAIVVQVRPEDYAAYGQGADDVLAGVTFQRVLEQRAYDIGSGDVPVETWGDFCEAAGSESAGSCQRDGYNGRFVIPYIKGRYRFAPVHDILPDELNQCIMEGMTAFGKKIKGFDAPDTLVAGVESRTSSPVRILRDETMQSVTVKGLYPAGEGAGYAGGIMSAAVDGIKVAERTI